MLLKRPQRTRLQALFHLLILSSYFAEEAFQFLEGKVRRVRIRDQEEDVAEYRFKDPRDLAIRLMAEIRCQISLYLDIFSRLYDMEAFKVRTP